MVDNLTQRQRSACMSRIRSSDTRPELIVRRLTHCLGYRFQLHDVRLPGRPDLVFSTLRKVIFVHGCFWHRHRCRRGRLIPRTNRTYWLKKLANNRSRDRTNRRRLKAMGWSTLILWECQLRDLGFISAAVIAFLEGHKRFRVNDAAF
jgi:DNA mismatch endonuclease, patch repair protein